MVAIGVDPGKNTGVAVWDAKGNEFLELDTHDFWGTVACAIQWKAHCREAGRRLAAYIEDPRGNKPVFNRGEGGRKNLKIAQNVGGVKKESELLIEGFRREGIVVVPIVPRQHKWDAATFKAITGLTGRTNQHVRDAARLVFGMGPMAAGQYEKLKDELETPAG